MPKQVRFDLDAVRAALLDQAAALQGFVDTLPDKAFERPTRLGNWTVAVLVAHVSRALGAAAEWIAAPEPAHVEQTLSSYYDAARASAAFVDSVSRQAAADKAPSELKAAVAESVRAMAAAVSSLREGQVVAARVGATAATDVLVTRCVEAVVHALDLQAATGVPASAPEAVRPAALAVVVKSFAAILRQRAPGHSVEVRIPGPGGTAFQCGEGPQHTRGTPPNVVETDPLTFVELGAGRLNWADSVASGVVRASGSRADLGALLPVIG